MKGIDKLAGAIGFIGALIAVIVGVAVCDSWLVVPLAVVCGTVCAPALALSAVLFVSLLQDVRRPDLDQPTRNAATKYLGVLVMMMMILPSTVTVVWIFAGSPAAMIAATLLATAGIALWAKAG